MSHAVRGPKVLAFGAIVDRVVSVLTLPLGGFIPLSPEGLRFFRPA
jgi:hypothetical protein